MTYITANQIILKLWGSSRIKLHFLLRQVNHFTCFSFSLIFIPLPLTLAYTYYLFSLAHSRSHIFLLISIYSSLAYFDRFIACPYILYFPISLVLSLAQLIWSQKWAWRDPWAGPTPHSGHVACFRCHSRNAAKDDGDLRSFKWTVEQLGVWLIGFLCNPTV